MSPVISSAVLVIITHIPDKRKNIKRDNPEIIPSSTIMAAAETAANNDADDILATAIAVVIAPDARISVRANVKKAD